MTKVPPGQVRIIAGTLRGSKLPVPDHPGLRPTSDRVRETLFNWLQHDVGGARVVDLYAGTGALGFEAASRGAAEVAMIERDATLAAQLRASAERLKCPAIRVETLDVLAWLAAAPAVHADLVFMDPPFDGDLWDATAQALDGKLAGPAWVYVERPPSAGFRVPAGWRLHREGRTRDVHFALYRVADPVAENR